MTLTPTTHSAMFAEETQDGLLVLLTITHSSLPVPIQVVNNTVNVHRHTVTDTLEDSTNNTNTAVLVGAPTPVAGIMLTGGGRALNFEPAARAEFSNDPVFDGASFTYEFWIEPETIAGSVDNIFSDNSMIVREVVGTSGFRFGFDHRGHLSFVSTSSGGTLNLAFPAPVVAVGFRTHVAVTYDATTSTGRLYTNGGLLAVATGAVNIPVGQQLTLNSVWPSGTGADASYDEFRAWNISRSGAAILRDHNRRLLGNEPGLVGYWPWSTANVFVGLPFRIVLPADEVGSPPSAQLEIDNVSLEIITAIRTATGTPPAVQIDVVRLLDQEAIELTFPPLNLRNARANVTTITGDLFSEDLQTDRYPKDDFTPGFFPGLF